MIVRRKINCLWVPMSPRGPQKSPIDGACAIADAPDGCDPDCYKRGRFSATRRGRALSHLAFAAASGDGQRIKPRDKPPPRRGLALVR
jgi:hypothetical protein